ncbi:MAG: hypothetical protein PHS82_04590 [Lachnospiraceae bacterium]|nr:hypothetical protein [Lachnospiraceae bacterium]
MSIGQPEQFAGGVAKKASYEEIKECRLGSQSSLQPELPKKQVMKDKKGADLVTNIISCRGCQKILIILVFFGSRRK